MNAELLILAPWLFVFSMPSSHGIRIESYRPVPTAILSRGVDSTQVHVIDYDGSSSTEQIKQILDGFALFLKGQNDFDGWIISYGGQRACEGEARTRADATKRYLISKGISADHIIFVDGGFRDQWTVQLYGAVRGTLGITLGPGLSRNRVKIITQRGKHRIAICPAPSI
jgi:hypothetical protein